MGPIGPRGPGSPTSPCSPSNSHIDQLLQNAKLSETINNQYRLAEDNFAAACVFFYNGGTYKLDQAFVAFLKNNTYNIVIDSNNTPFHIEDLESFTNSVEWHETQVEEFIDGTMINMFYHNQQK